MGGAQQPAIEFAKVFVTEAMGAVVQGANRDNDTCTGNNCNLYGEVIDTVNIGNGGGALRDVVQLYR
jgi:hypothetical protein